jgi:hypothetical protein
MFISLLLECEWVRHRPRSHVANRLMSFLRVQTAYGANSPVNELKVTASRTPVGALAYMREKGRAPPVMRPPLLMEVHGTDFAELS